MTCIDDWYYYAVAVIDPSSINWFLSLLTETYHVDANEDVLFKKMLGDFLGIHARYLSEFSGPIFFYSVPEYNIGRKNFSLLSDASHLEQEKNDIKAAIEASLKLSKPIVFQKVSSFIRKIGKNSINPRF
jgi:hypothetical protein